MSRNNDTVSRAVESLSGHSSAPEAVILSERNANSRRESAWAKYQLLASLAQDTLALVEAELSKPLVAGEPGHQGACRVHPFAEFPIRATQSGASEDIATHMNLPGCHSVIVEQVDWDSLIGAVS